LDEPSDTRRKYETNASFSRLRPRLEGVFYVLDTHRIPFHEDPDDIEPVRVVRPAVTVDPDRGRLRQLALLPPVYRLYRIDEISRASSLYLDKGHRAVPLGNEVDVAVPVPKPALQYPPAASPQPPFRDALADFAEFKPGR
jgi:hypothetical protein